MSGFWHHDDLTSAVKARRSRPSRSTTMRTLLMSGPVLAHERQRLVKLEVLVSLGCECSADGSFGEIINGIWTGMGTRMLRLHSLTRGYWSRRECRGHASDKHV
jgi:hypothetical protein